MANSEDPDLGLLYIVCPDLSVRKLRIIKVSIIFNPENVLIHRSKTTNKCFFQIIFHIILFPFFLIAYLVDSSKGHYYNKRHALTKQA